MASTFTPNIQLEQPARGDDAGTWDTPMNGNSTLLDRLFGITTINMSAGSVVLSAAQFQSGTITFNSTLTGNATVTFPTSFTKPYSVQNLCTGNFTITLQTTAAGGQVICAPPGETVDCFNDGANLKYKNLGRVGTFHDFYVTAIPAWITGCTVPPYLNCNGTTFSSGTYPALTTFLGGTTLPDSRGRVRAAMNQGTVRLTNVIADTLGQGGGDWALQSHNHTDVGHIHAGPNSVYGGTQFFAAAAGSDFNAVATPVALNTLSVATGQAAIANTGNGGSQNVQPTFMGGLTLIRAA